MKIKTLLSVALLSWAAPGSAIIEGVKADASAFPSYASIRTVSPYPVHEGKQMNACGATLVAPRWVPRSSLSRDTLSWDAHRHLL